MLGARRNSNILILASSISLIILLISVSYWYQDQSEDREIIIKNQEETIAHITTEMESLLIQRIELLDEILSPFWLEQLTTANLTSQSIYESFISKFFAFDMSLKALNFINTTGVIVNIYPFEPNQEVWNRSILTLANGQENTALIRSMDTNLISLTPYIPFVQGGTGVASYIPVLNETHVFGYFNALFDLHNIIAEYLANEPIVEQYIFSMYDGETLIYTSNDDIEIIDEFTMFRHYMLYNQVFESYLMLGPDFQQEMNFFDAPFLPIIGLLFSIISWYLIYVVFSRNEDKSKRIVEEQKFELLLNRYEKMNALGTLAGGLAHDFNNILMSIQGNLDLLQMIPESDDEAREEIFSTIDRILKASKDLTQRILSISRHQEFETQQFDIIEILNDTLKVFESIKDKRIEIIREFNHEESIAEVNYSHISQIFLNILNNSSDSFHHAEGRITIKTRTILNLKTSGNTLNISIRDNGSGIEAQHLKHIFDPFYTTKDIGKGTGLGLSIVHQYITKLGGNVSIYSVPSEGTELILEIPLLDEKYIKETSSLEFDEEELIEILNKYRTEKGSNPSLLIVEDEIHIAKSLQKMIDTIGIDTTVAYDGIEGLEMFQIDDYDLVILDINLPKLNGIDLGEKIVISNPKQKLLFITGFAESNIPLSIAMNSDLIQKPFSKRILFSKLCDLLA